MKYTANPHAIGQYKRESGQKGCSSCVVNASDTLDRLVAEGMFIDEKGQFQKIDRVVCSPEDKIREVMTLSNDISI